MEDLIIYALVFLSGLGGSKLTSYLKRASGALKESGELLTVLGESLEDGSLSKDDLGKILKEAKDLPDAYKRALKNK